MKRHWVLALTAFVLSVSSQTVLAAGLADLTLSPVRTALQLVLSPFAGSTVAGVLSSDRAANRDQLIETVVQDAAAVLDGETPTPLFQEISGLIRQELAVRGDQHPYNDADLAVMILAELK